jgi:renalase
MTNLNSAKINDVIIIGSGLSGITAARALRQQGRTSLVLDKGRRIGGRCSTKRKNGVIFNHGAQFFTAKDNHFQELIHQAEAQEAVSSWSFGHPNQCYIGAPTMRDFISHLANDICVEQDVKITDISRDEGIYHLLDDAGRSYYARHIICTIPAPQVSPLIETIAACLLPTVQSASYDPCWTVMLALKEPLSKGSFPVRDQGMIGWANYEPLRMETQEKTIYQPAVTIQASPEASHQMLSWQADKVIAVMTEQMEAIIGAEMISDFSLAHRW